jgi:transcriptional regulator with XRE-family HTH domain
VSEEQVDYELSDYAIRVKYIRQKMKMTQKELGNAAGCTDVAISNLETKVSMPHFDLMMRIVKAFGMTIYEFKEVKIPQEFINRMPKPYRKSSTKYVFGIIEMLTRKAVIHIRIRKQCGDRWKEACEKLA